MSDQSIHPAIPPGEQAVEFMLDGVAVTARKGETIIQVAERQNVYVPHYCWHPSLSVAGNCRLCLVEIHTPDTRNPGAMLKSPKPAIACQQVISPGMHVFTTSELAKSCQDGMMEFLLVNHPLDCPICDRGGECQLQRYSMEYGSGHTRMADKKRKFRKPEFDALIDIERNRCIMCTRCVRFCDEVAGAHVMGVFDRGEGNYIGTFGQGPVSNIFSGNVIDICPVGCLTSKPFRFRARAWELTQTQSTGVFDSSGPKVTYWTRGERLYRTTPPSRKYHGTYTVNEDTEEFIDNVTRFGSDFGRHPSRWADARVRMGGMLLPAARSEAVRATASALARIKIERGAETIAVLVSPKATMEEGYLAAKVARLAIGTVSIDWRSSLRSRAAADAVDLAFEYADGDMSAPVDALLLINADFQHQVPTLAMRLKEHARVLGHPIVMLGHYHDPYFAQHATARLTTAPGSTARAARLLWALRQGVGDTNSLETDLAQLTSSTVEMIRRVREILIAAKRGLVIQGLEECNGIYLPEEVPAAIALRQSLSDGWHYLPTIHDRNGFGLRLVGAQPGTLPAEMSAAARAWRVQEIVCEGGVAAPDMLEAIERGQIRALLCIGADSLQQLGDQDRVLAALRRLEFFALSDLFDSPYAQIAHVFFGSASHLERDGTYCDIQGNLARLVAAEEPMGSARPDWETLAAIGEKLAGEGFTYNSVEDIFNEMMKLLAPQFRGSFAGLMLPGPLNDVSIQDPGGARNFSLEYNPGDYRTDGAHFRPGRHEPLTPRIAPPHAAITGDGLILTFGEHVQADDYHLAHASIAKILRVEPYVEISARDAARLDIDDNQMVTLRLADDRQWDAAARVCEAGGPADGTVRVPSGVGPTDLRTLRSLVRVRIEPQAVRGTGRPLVAAAMID